MSLAASIQITDQDVRTVSANKGGERYGQTANTSDGRQFAYGLNGTGSGTALAPGKLTQGAFAVPNHVNITGVTLPANSNSVTYTIGATALTANQYQDGYFQVNAGTGAGQNLLVSNTTTSTAGSTAVTVNLKDATYVATSVTDSKFSLQPNEYSKVVIQDHTAPTAQLLTGVPPVSIPDANYGWFQIGGAAAVLINGTPGVGVPVVGSATTDGAVDVDTASLFQQIVGYMLVVGVSTTYKPVFLQINNA